MLRWRLRVPGENRSRSGQVFSSKDGTVPRQISRGFNDPSSKDNLHFPARWWGYDDPRRSLNYLLAHVLSRLPLHPARNNWIIELRLIAPHVAWIIILKLQSRRGRDSQKLRGGGRSFEKLTTKTIRVRIFAECGTFYSTVTKLLKFSWRNWSSFSITLGSASKFRKRFLLFEKY